MKSPIYPLILTALVALLACDPLNHGTDDALLDHQVEILSDTLCQWSEQGPSFTLSCTSGAGSLKLVYCVDGSYRDTLLFIPAEPLEVFPAEAFGEDRDARLLMHASALDTLKVDGKVISPSTRDTVCFKAYTRMIPQVTVEPRLTDGEGSITYSAAVRTYPMMAVSSAELVSRDSDKSYPMSLIMQSGDCTVFNRILKDAGFYTLHLSLGDVDYVHSEPVINPATIRIACTLESYEGRVRPVVSCSYMDSRHVDKALGLSLTVTAKGSCCWMEDFHQSVEECEAYQHNYVYTDGMDYCETLTEEDLIPSADHRMDIDLLESILRHRVDVKAAKNADGTVFKQNDPVLGWYVVFETFDKYYDLEEALLSFSIESGALEYVRIGEMDTDGVIDYITRLLEEEEGISNPYADSIANIKNILTITTE